MTFTECVRLVADRMNLKSEDALTRIGLETNLRYKEVMSSLGVSHVTERTTVTKAATIGNRLVTFGDSTTAVVKVLAVYDATVTPVKVLDEVSVDEMLNDTVVSDPPTKWAPYAMGARTVTVRVNSVPATAFVLSADVEANVSVLSGAMLPAFDEDFHDILVHGVYADELEKAEKFTLAERKEKRFEKRLSELRMHIAKTAYRELQQGRRAR